MRMYFQQFKMNNTSLLVITIRIFRLVWNKGPLQSSLPRYFRHQLLPSVQCTLTAHVSAPCSLHKNNFWSQPFFLFSPKSSFFLYCFTEGKAFLGNQRTGWLPGFLSVWCHFLALFRN